MYNSRTSDLHAHTTASDGDLSPTRLVELAHSIGLTALAVTDHDTTAGIAEAQVAGERLGIEIVPGIELSADIDRGQCHLLGLFIDPQNASLQYRLLDIVEKREARNNRIIALMNADGVDITLEEAKEVAGGEIIARPHFARLLIQKGRVETMAEAFDHYLARGGGYYVERERIGQAEAIQLIHGAGGVAILAHPNNLKLSVEETEKVILSLQEKGLDGIEARYNLHTPSDNTRYLALAEKYGLLTSGGSDFHGLSVKPIGFLDHVEVSATPLSVLEALREKHRSRG
ncbi:MAG: PHP domain-containing protein, partial [Chthonomonadaceae bacterium]|nr:PHP domain-containing protein [Chthonomonadaceae bacterium]